MLNREVTAAARGEAMGGNHGARKPLSEQSRETHMRLWMTSEPRGRDEGEETTSEPSHIVGIADAVSIKTKDIFLFEFPWK